MKKLNKIDALLHKYITMENLVVFAIYTFPILLINIFLENRYLEIISNLGIGIAYGIVFQRYLENKLKQKRKLYKEKKR